MTKAVDPAGIGHFRCPDGDAQPELGSCETSPIARSVAMQQACLGSFGSITQRWVVCVGIDGTIAALPCPLGYIVALGCGIGSHSPESGLSPSSDDPALWLNKCSCSAPRLEATPPESNHVPLAGYPVRATQNLRTHWPVDLLIDNPSQSSRLFLRRSFFKRLAIRETSPAMCTVLPCSIRRVQLQRVQSRADTDHRRQGRQTYAFLQEPLRAESWRDQPSQLPNWFQKRKISSSVLGSNVAKGT